MNREETIKLTDKLLKNIPDIRKRIKLIDVALKKDSYDMGTIENLKQERHRLHEELTKAIGVISTLDDERQRIICYKYFDKLNNQVIAIRLGVSSQTIPRRIKKSLLAIGRRLFGMEEEFWNNFM